MKILIIVGLWVWHFTIQSLITQATTFLIISCPKAKINWQWYTKIKLTAKISPRQRDQNWPCGGKPKRKPAVSSSKENLRQRRRASPFENCESFLLEVYLGLWSVCFHVRPDAIRVISKIKTCSRIFIGWRDGTIRLLHWGTNSLESAWGHENTWQWT
jgi:hypothetical protein